MRIKERFCGAEFKHEIKEAYFEDDDDGLRQFCRIIHVYRFGGCSIEIEKTTFKVFQRKKIVSRSKIQTIATTSNGFLFKKNKKNFDNTEFSVLCIL